MYLRVMRSLVHQRRSVHLGTLREGGLVFCFVRKGDRHWMQINSDDITDSYTTEDGK
jgi:hypothetical protein